MLESTPPAMAPVPPPPPLMAPPSTPASPTPRKSSRATPNLKDIINGKPEAKPKDEATPQPKAGENRPVSLDELKQVWEVFAEQRKTQAAEYHLLKREIKLEDTTVKVELSNPVEEPLLHSIKAVLTTHLREQLGNNSISVVGEVMAIVSKKVAYTNKEKFEHMTEKNSAIKELREKLGLDPDF